MSNLIAIQGMLVSLVKLTELNEYTDDLPEEQKQVIRAQIDAADRKVDALVREFKGWGIGDTVEEQYGVRYVVVGYFIPDGYRHVNVRLGYLKKDGSRGARTTWHSLDAHLVKASTEPATT